MGTAEWEIWTGTLSDDAVGEALDAWKDWVRGQGFEFDDPHHAFDSALSAAKSGDHDRERVIATTDAECNAESNLDLAALLGDI